MGQASLYGSNSLISYNVPTKYKKIIQSLTFTINIQLVWDLFFQHVVIPQHFNYRVLLFILLLSRNPSPGLFIAQFRENTDGCASTESLREFHEVSYLYITHKSTSGMNWLCPLAFANGDTRSWIPAMRSEQLHGFLDFSTIALRHKSLPSSETNIIVMTCQINTTLKTF